MNFVAPPDPFNELIEFLNGKNWVYKLSSEKGKVDTIAWGAQTLETHEGFCHLCGLEKYQICFHVKSYYISEVEKLIVDRPGDAAKFAWDTYRKVLDSLDTLPEKNELIRKPPHTFFHATYNAWLKNSHG